MDVLLSIKPEFADRIVAGDKKFEFRRVIFKSYMPESVFIYVSSPIKKIVGSFRVGGIYEGRPKTLWRRFRTDSGMKREEFFGYFADVEYGYAIKIESFVLFDSPLDPFAMARDFIPPQSFCYLDGQISELAQDHLMHG